MRLFLLFTLLSTSVFAQESLSTSRYVVGGALGTVPGLGIGHAVQNRWMEKGWIFTAGEVASLSLLLTGGVQCSIGSSLEEQDCENASLALATSAFLALKVWEIVDVWRKPSESTKVSWVLSPLAAPQNLGLGLAFNF